MKIYNRLLLPVALCMVRLYMSVLKNGVLLHNRKAENRPNKSDMFSAFVCTLSVSVDDKLL